MRLAGINLAMSICVIEIACTVNSAIIRKQESNDTEKIYKLLDHDDPEIRDNTTQSLIQMWESGKAKESIESVKEIAIKEKNEEVIQRSTYILERIKMRSFLGKEILIALDERREVELGEIVVDQDITNSDIISKLLETFEKWMIDIDTYQFDKNQKSIISKWIACKLKYLCFKREFIELVRNERLKDCLDGVIILIDDPSLPEFIDGVLNALFLAEKEHSEKIVKFLEHNHHRVKSKTIDFIQRLGWNEYIPQIAKGLDDLHKDVRYCAVKALTEFGAKEYVDEIAKLIDDKNLTGFIIKSLSTLQAVKYKNSIAKYLTNASAYIRGEAAEGLGRLGAKDYVEKIARLLNDKEDSVKCSAIIALRYLKAKEYAPHIATFLDYRSPFLIKAHAALALGEMKERKYIPQIKELLKSSCDHTKWYALLALQQLDSQGTYKEYSKKNEDELDRLTIMFKD